MWEIALGETNAHNVGVAIVQEGAALCKRSWAAAKGRRPKNKKHHAVSHLVVLVGRGRTPPATTLCTLADSLPQWSANLIIDLENSCG